MTRGELRLLLDNAFNRRQVFKMSLGKDARYRKEALDKGVLIFSSEITFYDAVVSGDPGQILSRGRRLKSDVNPMGNAPDTTIAGWRKSANTFRLLEEGSLVLHWEADRDALFWCISAADMRLDRQEEDEFGATDYVFHRQLMEPWRRTSLAGVPLTNMRSPQPLLRKQRYGRTKRDQAMLVG